MVLPEFPALSLVQTKSLFFLCPTIETQHPRAHRPSCLGHVHSKELEGEIAICESTPHCFAISHPPL